jgi:hypothetical protein
MSRVRDLVRVAGTYQSKPGTASAFRGRRLPLVSQAPMAPLEQDQQERKERTDSNVAGLDLDGLDLGLNLAGLAPIARRPKKAPLSIPGRLRRLLRRWMGVRSAAPTPKCNGVTRRGLPCQGPAMPNGYCRMHGGSRNVFASSLTASNLM